jgi:hypothetical protein
LARDGGAPAIVATGVVGPTGLAVDSTDFYWAENYPGETGDLRFAPVVGGDAGGTTLLSNLTGPQEIVVDGAGPGETIYFSSGNGITRLLPDAGTQTISPMDVQRTGSSLGYLVIDGPYFYWANDSQIYRALK